MSTDKPLPILETILVVILNAWGIQINFFFSSLKWTNFQWSALVTQLSRQNEGVPQLNSLLIFLRFTFWIGDFLSVRVENTIPSVVRISDLEPMLANVRRIKLYLFFSENFPRDPILVFERSLHFFSSNLAVQQLTPDVLYFQTIPGKCVGFVVQPRNHQIHDFWLKRVNQATTFCWRTAFLARTRTLQKLCELES